MTATLWSHEGEVGLRVHWRGLEIAAPKRRGWLDHATIEQMVQEAIDTALECERRGHAIDTNGSKVTPL